ncbi:enoyl-CoA hydratase [Falsiroseomonas selenitidurans]|uniref:Enoyl-CoA hydratase domain-containing protein 3, mitochondrial n=1 Tax=Falsiroseomonas selenitidurans TaxID=2716335 RepID=A0ABX1EDN4_9PROT|nr:enoyl-CoA hydratase [Falsiroseomonas selenitidurans]NKC33010.1 enoyl-CoA hydratase [Falsiroseomonas selenitidurans]
MPEGSTPLLLRQDSAAGVTRLTLNRPDSRNALSFAMLGALHHALAEIALDDSVRVVVLAAAGPVFCAGHDLREITAHRNDEDGGRAFFTAAMDRCAAVMQAVVALPQPVIASVQGIATAAGCQLVASCDLAVASAAARFCTPGVDIGLFCSTPAVALSRAVAAKPAMEMLLTGEMVPAEEARRIGLVNRVVPAEGLAAATDQLAGQIAARSAHTVRLGKAAFHRQRGLPLDAAYAHCAAVMTENLMAADAAEGIGAFLAKRKPVWQDR